MYFSSDTQPRKPCFWIVIPTALSISYSQEHVLLLYVFAVRAEHVTIFQNGGFFQCAYRCYSCAEHTFLSLYDCLHIYCSQLPSYPQAAATIAVCTIESLSKSPLLTSSLEHQYKTPSYIPPQDASPHKSELTCLAGH